MNVALRYDPRTGWYFRCWCDNRGGPYETFNDMGSALGPHVQFHEERRREGK